MQAVYCTQKNLPRIFTGKAPELFVVCQAFGEGTAEGWIIAQLFDLAAFCGNKEKPTDNQYKEIARVILSQFGHLKVTEMMYFFLLFKAGKFGKFYGAVDGLAITEALQTFAKMRIDILAKYEQEERERKAEQEAEERKGKTISREQWERIKWKYGMRYDRHRRPTKRKITSPTFWHTHFFRQITLTK